MNNALDMTPRGITDAMIRSRRLAVEGLRDGHPLSDLHPGTQFFPVQLFRAVYAQHPDNPELFVPCVDDAGFWAAARSAVRTG